MSKSVIAKRSRAYRLSGTYAVLSFLYTLQAVLAGGSAEAQVPASPGSGRRRGTMVKRAVVVGSLAVAIAGITLAREAGAQVPALSALPVSGPTNVADFVSDPGAAKVLGKALFWDMQVGSDGVQACATCHFRAGADPRSQNQIGPGLLRVAIKPGPVVVSDPNFDFDGLGPHYRLRRKDFTFRQLADPTDRESSITSDTNNVVSSQGVHHAIFGQEGRPGPDPDGFSVGQDRQKANVRRRAAQHATMINAVFHHRNFLGPAGPKPVQRRESVRQSRCQRVPLPRRRSFEPPEDNRVPSCAL